MTYYYLSFWLRFFLFLFIIIAGLFSLSNYVKTLKRSYLNFGILFILFFCKDVILFYTGWFIPGAEPGGSLLFFKLLFETVLLILFFWNYSSHISNMNSIGKAIQLLALVSVTALSIATLFTERVGVVMAINSVMLVYILFMFVWTIRYQASYYYKELIGRGTYFTIIYIALSILGIYFSLSIVFDFLYLPFFVLFFMICSILFILMSFRPYFKVKDKIEFNRKENRLILDMINRVSYLQTANREFEVLMKTILSSLITSIHAHSGALFFYNKDTGVLQAGAVEGMFPPPHPVKGHMKTKTDYIIKKIKSTKVAPGETYIGQVAQSREPLIIAKPQQFHDYPELVESASGLVELESLVAFPLQLQDQLLGVIVVLSEQDRPFSESDINIIQTFSDQAALTINNVRLYNEFLEKQKTEKELEVAGFIQQNLFPKKMPDLQNLSVFTYCRSAKMMGGDYYDIIDFGKDRTGIFICDVVGKGVPAAMIMVMIRTILRTISRENMSPDKIIELVNKNLHAQSHSQDTFATVFYMLYDDKSRKLIYSNAGHSPLLIYNNKGGVFEELDTEGIPIGITEESEYGVGQRTLKDGDVLVLYTDGITEAKDKHKNFYGEERFKDFIKTHVEKPTQELGNMIIEDINHFAEDVEQHDDQTLILVKCGEKKKNS